MFNLFKKKKKIIYHAGAWAGNFGDSILHQSIQGSLTQCSRNELEFRNINCQQTEFTKELIVEINREGDLLLIGGGGLIFYRPQDHSKSGWQWNIDIQLIDMINTPFVIYGVGYNQFEYDTSNFIPVTNRHLEKTVRLAAIFSVRNSGTKRELIARGCDGDRIEIIPDSGMFLSAKKISIPGLDANKLNIGFNWTTDRENQTFPEPHSENRDKFLAACLELFNYAIKEKNAQIIYIGHMGKEFDKGIIGTLKSGLLLPPLIIDEELSHIYPPDENNAGYLVDVYRQMDIVLGMRGHANIVSFGQSTPFIGIGSHRKVRYFLEDIGRRDYFIDVRAEGNLYSISKMKSCLNGIIENAAWHRQAIKREYEKQKLIFDNFNKRVVKLL